MKNWLKHIKVLGLIILVMLAASLFVAAQENTPEESANKWVEQKIDQLTNELNLDGVQKNLVRKILDNEVEQAEKDRRSFKLDALKLIEAAKKRVNTRNAKIEALLNEEQKRDLERMKRLSPFDRELEMWKEGLLLNDEQAFNMEGILIESYNEMEEMMPDGMEPGMGAPPGGGKDGIRPGKGGPGGPHMKHMNRKKLRRIKKELNKEQIPLFKQIADDLKKKQKEMRKNKDQRPPV